jgi:transposase
MLSPSPATLPAVSTAPVPAVVTMVPLVGIDEMIERLDAAIAERRRTFQEQIARLDTMPRVGERTAQVLAAEIGLRMSLLSSADHLASGAGMAPGNSQSGGRHRNEKTRKGSMFLHRALIEAAHAAARKKGSSFAAR